jgi:hypothetical protein
VDVEATVDEEKEVGTMVVMVSKVFENKEDYIGICVKYLVRMWKQMLLQQI